MSTEDLNIGSSSCKDVDGSTPRNRSYFIDDDTLVQVIKDTIEDEEEIGSLSNFTVLVNSRLLKNKYKHKTTPGRIKHLVQKHNLAVIRVKVRRGGGHGFSDECPVCLNKMVNERNATIYGWKITSKKKCTRCGFWTDRKKTSVARYIFHSRKKS